MEIMRKEVIPLEAQKDRTVREYSISLIQFGPLDSFNILSVII